MKKTVLNYVNLSPGVQENSHIPSSMARIFSRGTLAWIL
jgi:hypothetical protein